MLSIWGKVFGKLSAGTLAWVQRHDELDARREREVAAKVDELNEAIKASAPVAWWPDNKRIDVELLWAAVEDTEDVA